MEVWNIRARASDGNQVTVFDLISEHTLISEPPPHFILVKTNTKAHRDLCVLAALLCSNRYLMLINHPTDGATRGLTLRVRFLGRN